MKRTLTLLLAVACYTSAAAQEKQRPELAFHTIPAEFRGYPKIVRLNHAHVKITGPGSYELIRDYAVTVTREQKNPELFGAGYDKYTKINTLEAAVYDSTGALIRKSTTLDALDIKLIEELQFYDDSRAKYHAISHNVYPYTVVFHVKETHSSSFHYPSWMPYTEEEPVVATEFIVETSKDNPIKYQLANGAIAPQRTDDDKHSRLIWRAQNLRPKPDKLAGPKGINAEPHVRLMQPGFVYAGYKGRSDDWKAFGAFLYDLFYQRQELPADEVLKVKEITANLKTDKEKARAAYRYLQNSTRYVAVMFGIGGFQPMTPKEVKENGFGECKALSNYLVAMLDTIGIQAYHAIVYANPDWRAAPLLDNQFPESKANHCIAMAILDGDSTWFECTSDNLTMGDLSDFTENRRALLLTPKGGVLVYTPISTARKNTRTSFAKARLESDGSLSTEFHIIQKGSWNSEQRSFLNNAPNTQWEKHFREELPLPNFEIKRVDYGRFQEPDTTLVTSGSLNIPRYTSQAGTRTLVKPNLFSKLDAALPEDSNRTEPVWLRRPFTQLDTVDLALPEGFRLSRTPDPITIDGPCGSYQTTVSYTPETHTVRYVRRVVVDRFRLPASAYEGVRSFFQKVVKADAAPLVLMKGT